MGLAQSSNPSNHSSKQAKMSFASINAAVSKVVLEAKLKTLDDLLAFMETEVDVDDELKESFEKFKAQIKANHKETPEKKTRKSKKESDGEAETKPKRKASLFNIYVREKMAEIKAENPGLKGGAMKMASEAWNTDPFALFLKDNQKKIKEDNSDSDNETIYEKAKELFQDQDAGSSSEESSPPKELKKSKAKRGKKPAKASDSDDDM